MQCLICILLFHFCFSPHPSFSRWLLLSRSVIPNLPFLFHFPPLSHFSLSLSLTLAQCLFLSDFSLSDAYTFSCSPCFIPTFLFFPHPMNRRPLTCFLNHQCRMKPKRAEHLTGFWSAEGPRRKRYYGLRKLLNRISFYYGCFSLHFRSI